MSDTPVSLEDQLQIARRQIQQLDREKGQLAGQLKEVITMNKRWQKYNRQQEQLRKELEQTKIDLQNQIKVRYRTLRHHLTMFPLQKTLSCNAKL